MIAAVELLTFLWLGCWAVRCALAISRGDGASVDFVVVVHFILCGTPLALDLLFGVPEYARYPGLAMSSLDQQTRLIYCLYVGLCPLFWNFTGRPRQKHGKRLSAHNGRSSDFSSRYPLFLFLMVIAPSLAVWLSPMREMYSTYSMESRNFWNQSDATRGFHMYLSALCTLSVIAAAGLVLSSRNLPRTLLFLIPPLLADFWLVGKRSIVAVALALIVYALWYRGVFRSRATLYLTGCGAVLVLGVFSVIYQSSVRDIDLEARSWDYVYENARIDFGRDDVIRMAIYGELHPNELQILESRMESLWIYASLPIPRSWWPDKPLPYGTSVACEAMLVEKQYLQWGMTTSVLEEAIANASWLGMLLGPLVISIVCRIGDSCQDGLIGVFTILIALLLMTQHLSAFAPVALAWCGLVLLCRWSRVSQHVLASGRARQCVAQ